ncbi:MAG TPA: glycerophosphodiester phosphodiesterase family protein [Ferruginibacter sp.]|nr:glycerophosphodiester phosphodiesterase family protein [Ferruginibacter sp.]
MKNNLLFFLIALAFACNNNKKMTTEKPANQPEKFDKQGHRGCRGLMPENTVAAMLYALNLNVTTLEMDVVISKDKKVVLSHDPYFNHEITTKPDGSYLNENEEKKYNIYQMMYTEVKTFDVGMKPHPRFTQQQKIKAIKPLLSDVFTAIKNEMMVRKRPFPYFNIETKSTVQTDNIFHQAPEEFVELLMAVVNEFNLQEQVTIQSFDIRTLQYLHKKFPQVKTALLIESYDRRSINLHIEQLGFTPTVYSPSYNLVTNELTRQCHEKNMQIIPWTVNEKEKIKELKNMGVDGIISDYPNLFDE